MSKIKQKELCNRAGQAIKIGLSGKLGDPYTAENILQEEFSDFVVLTESLIADPLLFNKIKANKIADIQPSLYEANELQHTRWLQNNLIAKTTKPLRIAIIGAGVSGSNCALGAVEKGHQVWLFDKNKKAGGHLLATENLPLKQDQKKYLKYLNNRLEQVAQQGFLHLKFDTVATLAMLRMQNFDKIVFATGKKAVNLKDVEAIDALHAIEYIKTHNLNKIVIVGGGKTGVELALSLRNLFEKLDITILEKENVLLKKYPQAERGYYLQLLKKHQIKAKVGVWQICNLQDIKSDTAKISDEVYFMQKRFCCNMDPLIAWLPVEWINKKSARSLLRWDIQQKMSCDLLINAAGYIADYDYYEYINDSNICDNIYFAVSDTVQGLTEMIEKGTFLGQSL